MCVFVVLFVSVATITSLLGLFVVSDNKLAIADKF